MSGALLSCSIQAVYQSLLRLSWIDNLLHQIRILFTQLYQDQLRTSRKSTFFYDFDNYFERQYQKLEKETEGSDALLSETDTGEELTPASSSDNDQNMSVLLRTRGQLSGAQRKCQLRSRY